MKKLKLDVETLTVDSFEIPAEDEPRGTVRGNAATDDCTYTCGDPFSSLYRYWRKVTTY